MLRIEILPGEIWLRFGVELMNFGRNLFSKCLEEKRCCFGEVRCVAKPVVALTGEIWHSGIQTSTLVNDISKRSLVLDDRRRFATQSNRLKEKSGISFCAGAKVNRKATRVGQPLEVDCWYWAQTSRCLGRNLLATG
ncbi:hypothetical protein F511_25182 [Dorcoceras hygrometricum]|uniref:Uncharacterized protein n=1 Tax=Dorcoceras hygrometricum TaxID=472368 RepID=A0A2Z7BJQ8_9LAMI|nr:hypothetical protein F511_25182 [Dorcoceras hygrometricum]